MKALCVPSNASTKMNVKQSLAIKLTAIVTYAQKVLHGTVKSVHPFVTQINCGTESHALVSQMLSESILLVSYAGPTRLLIKTKCNAFAIPVLYGALGNQLVSVLPAQSIHSQS